MATSIPQRELRNNNAEILNRVEAGESFVVTRNGVAVADVVPHVSSSRPPMFRKTKDLQVGRVAGISGTDREAWLADIHAAGSFLVDDPLDSRA